MDTYAVKSAGSAVNGCAVSAKERSLIETLGSAVETADHIESVVTRIAARLLSSAEPVAKLENSASPPCGNVQMDAERIRRTLSSIENTLEYLEGRLG